eukprot:GFUD01000472.1.p1 GENE.GFUD01000472.1~~GFUD01000472.1.p1  ORF type:complete len:513 (-),score=171.21 GFUD01000472.1:902-2377(-)
MDEKLRNMVLAFRMSELQSLMVFSGKSKAGKKTDLQTRAVELVRIDSSDINIKIKDLSNSMYKSLGSNAEATSITSTQGASYSNPYTDPIPPSPPPAHKLVYPTYPDVSLKKLPFYKIEETLLKPCSLQPNGNGRFQEQNFTFYLTPGQTTEISNSSYRNEQGKPEYRKQVQMRFSLLETSCEQEDNFPSSICVKVNGKLCPLPNPIPTNKPGAEPKRPPRPINITPLCKLSSTTANYINVSWAVEVGRAHTVSVYHVENLTYKDLLDQLKGKGLRQPDYTRALIKEKLADQDQEIATTSCKVTLACPLGKMRMNAPCRASTCDHLQCFDAQLYLQMNEKKPKWICPVCNKPALVENLLVDGFFMELIKSPRLPVDEHEIVLHNDGTWDPLPPKKDQLTQFSYKTAAPAKVTTTLSVTDSDTDSPNPTPGPSGQASGPPPPDNVDCITLDSDSEDEVETPPKKRIRLDSSSETTNDTDKPGSPDLICLDDD